MSEQLVGTELRDRWLLAFETSGRSGSVAIIRHNDKAGESIAQESLDSDFGSAKTLAPAIDRLLKRCQLEPTDLIGFGVISGPGSFTGLRVGVSTAKAMAYALSIPIVEIDTLDVIAAQVNRHKSQESSFFAALDAYRGQVFIAQFARGMRSSETRIMDIADAVEWIGNTSTTASTATEPFSHAPVVLAGAGASRLIKHWQALDSNKQIVAPKLVDERISEPQASTVAMFSLQRLRENKTIDPFLLLPQYYRASAAEEKASKAL